MSHVAPDSAFLTAGPRAHGGTVGATEAPAATPASPGAADRLRSIVAEHYAPLWRFLRRLGVPHADAEDAAQTCLWITAQRIDDIEPGKDRSFLFGVAARVAKKATRRASRRELDGSEESLAELPSLGPDPGEQLDDRRARAVLDLMLESLPLDLRTVFVLYELEELTMVDIARALAIPMGTVASRLRRARQAFEQLSRRVRRDSLRKAGLR